MGPPALLAPPESGRGAEGLAEPCYRRARGHAFATPGNTHRCDNPAVAPPPTHPRLDYAFGDIRVEPTAHRVLRDGHELDLEPKAYAVLLQFLTHPGELIKHDDLLEQVWGHKYVTAATLSRVISQLRQKLGDEAAEPHYIQTVHGLGYRLIARVAAGHTPDAPVARLDGPGPPRHPDRDRHSIAVLPFVNMSGELENEYFSDGIAEEILSLLTK